MVEIETTNHAEVGAGVPSKNAGTGVLRVMAFSALVLLFATVSRGGALQFRAEDYDDGVWPSAGVSVKMRSARQASDTNVWAFAVKSGGAVRFGVSRDKIVSPMEFDGGSDENTNTVSYVMALVFSDAAEDFSTFLSAPCPLRHEAAKSDRPFAEEDSARLLESRFGLTNSVLVNASAGEPRLEPAVEPQLLECEFSEPLRQSSLWLGGTGIAEFPRPWFGGVAEIIFLSEVPTEREKNCMRRYFVARHPALRHGVKTQYDAGVVEILSGLKIDSSGLFNTMLLVR